MRLVSPGQRALYSLEAVDITVEVSYGYIVGAWDDRKGVSMKSPYWRAEEA